MRLLIAVCAFAMLPVSAGAQDVGRRWTQRPADADTDRGYEMRRQPQSEREFQRRDGQPLREGRDFKVWQPVSTAPPMVIYRPGAVAMGRICRTESRRECDILAPLPVGGSCNCGNQLGRIAR